MPSTITDSLEEEDEDDTKEIKPIDYYGILNISRNVLLVNKRQQNKISKMLTNDCV
jgi:hypothetical protein